jgi:HK97 family phage major capsid protein
MENLRLNRDASIDAARAAADESTGDLVVELAFASEIPYERWWGVEILDCKPEAVRLGRLNDGGAVLYNHDWNDLRGVHEAGTARCDADAVARTSIRLTSATQAGRDAIGLVRGGILTKTSVGYEIHKVIEQTTSKSGEQVSREIDGRAFLRTLTRSQSQAPGDVAAFRRALDAHAGPFERGADPAIYRVVDWEPLENSLVTVPADPSVGIGRMAAPPAAPDPEPVQQKAKPMSDPVVDVAAIESRAAQSAADAANKRVAEILALEDQFKGFSEVTPMAQQALRNGESVADFTKRLMDHISKGAKKVDLSIGMSTTDAQNFSLMKAVRAVLSGDWSKAGYERECSQAVREKAIASGVQPQSEKSFFMPVEVQRRDLTVASATGGGNMVATNLRPQDFIELLRNRMVMRQLGMRMLGGLVGNADITKQTAAGTAYWLSTEATGITESQQTVGLLQLRPKIVGAYTEVSRLLLQQSTPDADAFVVDDLTKVIALAVDAAAINGNGSGAPTGVLNTGFIGAFTGTSLGIAALLNAQEDLATANALVGGCAYLTTPAVASLLAQRQRFASTDTPLWVGNLLDGNVLGFQAKSTPQMPAATALFGDFSQVILAEWGSIEIDANPYANFAAGITGIRAFYTCDIGVRIAGAFSAASTIT